MWERLGYPRRALRLHAAAVAIVERHGGEVPVDARRTCWRSRASAPTRPPPSRRSRSAARHAVARHQRPPRLRPGRRRAPRYPPPALTAAETALAERLLPVDDAHAARWAVATMELGALVCTARAPRCETCPVADLCRWRLDGAPEHDGPPRRGQAYAGHRPPGPRPAARRPQAAEAPLTSTALEAAAPDAVLRDPLQRSRALDGLVADGLVEPLAEGLYRLPGAQPVLRLRPAARDRADLRGRAGGPLRSAVRTGGPRLRRQLRRALRRPRARPRRLGQLEQHPGVAEGVGLDPVEVEELRDALVVERSSSA